MTDNIATVPRTTLRRRIRNKVGAMSMRSLLRLIFLLLCLSMASPALSQQGAGRVALVIGNANYLGDKTPLPGTINDARAMADEFRRNTFDVDFKENVSRESMLRAIAEFLDKISSNTTALFYFSGYGLQAARRSYLIPVDAQIRTEEDVWRDGFSVEQLVEEMNRKNAKTKIIIIDAARENLFERRFRQSPAGLAPIVTPVGTLALYSAAPGKVIKDGNAAKSLFVTELIKELHSPNLTAEEAFNHARVGVSRASNNEQVPMVASSLAEEFYFSPSRSLVIPPPQAPAPPQREPAPIKSEGGNVLRDCPDCPGLVVAPAGSFEMGSATTDYDKPIHRVSISKAFAIGRYEVTFTEWDKCVDDGGCKQRPNDRGWGRGARPVINVSWLDAKEYVAWLSKKTGHVYRLPSEAEWEYAARAGTSTSYWWGGSVDARQANCRECKTGQAEQTLPVGSYKPNAFGLFDTAGNAAEWVEDCWNDNYRGAPTDGSAWVKGDCQLRVLRGGSFGSEAGYVRPTARFRYDADVPYSANGFRVVRELQ